MEDLEAEFNKIKDYDFNFENLAFEGGGVKMASYIGVVKVLEAIGVLQKCRRFAGTSGGSIVAMLLAINENADDVHKFLFSLPVNDLVTDSSLGKLALVPNMLKEYGWNPANRFVIRIRKELKRVTGNPDITFKEVYERYGNLLCIPATNVSTMSVEYFHPKTSPNFSVALAVRASISLPGYMQPVCISGETGLKQYYTDGGLLCNFPLHVFDGWYLSMEPKDSFFNRIGESDPFKEFNPQTLGFVLYTPWEGEFMQGELHARFSNHTIERPSTPLAKHRGAKCDHFLAENLRNQRTMEAAKRFLNLLREMDADKDFTISLDEFRNAFVKLKMKEEDVNLLFGGELTFNKAFLEMDRDGDGHITFDEFLLLLQKQGINYQSILEGGSMMEITSFGQFFETTFNALLNNSRKVFFKEDDIHRSAGIYTDYIDTADFTLQKNDKKFLVNQGIRACLAYFQHIVGMHQKGTLPLSMASVISEKSAADKQSIKSDGFTINIEDDLTDNAEMYDKNTATMSKLPFPPQEFDLLRYEHMVKESNHTKFIILGFVCGLVMAFVLGAVVVYGMIEVNKQ